MKRTSLRRGKPLARGTKPLRRRTPLRQQSPRRRRLAPKRRQFVREVLEARPLCEAPERALAALQRRKASPRRAGKATAEQATTKLHGICERRAVDVHELVRRSQGGDILDADGVLALCRRCHEWIGANPELAFRLGLAERGLGRAS